MRVVGYIDHPRFKISILHHNAKFTIQIEDEELSHSFAIRESENIQTVQDIKSLTTDELILSITGYMDNLRETWENHIPQQGPDDDFETII